ncbi:metal-dependent hydrolase [Geobacillus stearothermophilus]|nr:metal-dependent hydrolase [Geobacillus stearothermophilus]
MGTVDPIRYPIGMFQVQPEGALRPMPLYVLTALYAWHGRHHTAQIVSLRKRKGW